MPRWRRLWQAKGFFANFKYIHKKDQRIDGSLCTICKHAKHTFFKKVKIYIDSMKVLTSTPPSSVHGCWPGLWHSRHCGESPPPCIVPNQTSHRYMSSSPWWSYTYLQYSFRNFHKTSSMANHWKEQRRSSSMRLEAIVDTPVQAAILFRANVTVGKSYCSWMSLLFPVTLKLLVQSQLLWSNISQTCPQSRHRPSLLIQITSSVYVFIKVDGPRQPS